MNTEVALSTPGVHSCPNNVPAKWRVLEGVEQALVRCHEGSILAHGQREVERVIDGPLRAVRYLKRGVDQRA